MPIYESVCMKCNTRHEYIKSSANCYDTPECCDTKTEKRIFTSPLAQFDIAPWDSFVSPATGKVINSKSQRREDMKASGCRDWEGMATEKQIAANCKKEEAAREDAILDTAVRKSWAQLAPDKKQVMLNT